MVLLVLLYDWHLHLLVGNLPINQQSLSLDTVVYYFHETCGIQFGNNTPLIIGIAAENQWTVYLVVNLNKINTLYTCYQYNKTNSLLNITNDFSIIFHSLFLSLKMSLYIFR